MSLLNGQIRTRVGEQEYIARAIPIGTRAQPIHALFEVVEIGPWMRLQVVADGYQILAVKDLIGFSVPACGNRRFPERRVAKTGDITLNNIKLDNSTIGVINTGNIETVDAAVTSLKQSGDQSVRAALLAVSEVLLANAAINNELKNHLVEMLKCVGC